jgi:pimeloyl-ACP methyl ester carboxylesterase
MSREQAVLLGAGRGLAAIITDPAPGASSAAVAAICLNAGVIHRVGPSRLHVHVARALAAAGWIAARFDHAGLGDSPVRKDGLPFEQSSVLETREVMDALQQSRRTDRFVLVGLCSGAVTAFNTALVDERVAGIVMINPWRFDETAEWTQYVTTRGSARKYVSRSFFRLDSWKRALTGRIHYRRLISVLSRQAVDAFAPPPAVATVATRVAGEFQTLLRRGVRVLLLCSEGDEGIESMNVILGRDLRRGTPDPLFEVEIMRGVDHSLTLLESQRHLVQFVRDWARRFDNPARRAATSGERANVPVAVAGPSL